jgi:hypothetical protein
MGVPSPAGWRSAPPGAQFFPARLRRRTACSGGLAKKKVFECVELSRSVRGDFAGRLGSAIRKIGEFHGRVLGAQSEAHGRHQKQYTFHLFAARFPG